MRLFRLLILAIVMAHGVCDAIAGQDEAPIAQPPLVRVLEQGEPPLRTLRYRATVGDRVQLIQRQRIDVRMSLEGQDLGDNSLPTMVSQMDFEVVAVDLEADRITCDFRVLETSLEEDGGLEDDERARLEMEWEGFRIDGRITFDSRGRIIDSSMNIGDEVRQEARELIESFAQNLQNIVSPLPEQAVGIRSTWEVLTTMNVGGIASSNRALYTIDKFEGDRVFTRSLIDVNSPGAEIPSPEPGVSFRLLESKGSGEARSVFDLASPVSVQANASINVEQTVEMTSEFGVQKIHQSLVMAIDVSSVEPPPANHEEPSKP